jgi:hypothetical protein
MSSLTVDLYSQAVQYAHSLHLAQSCSNEIFHSIVAGKFAELIVLECSRFTNEQLAYDSVDGQMIREHFGVE